jgi:preprotein translocase subunit SecG
VLATVFFITSLGLSFLASSKQSAPASVMEGAQTAPATSPAPAVPVESSPAQSIPK